MIKGDGHQEIFDAISTWGEEEFMEAIPGPNDNKIVASLQERPMVQHFSFEKVFPFKAGDHIGIHLLFSKMPDGDRHRRFQMLKEAEEKIAYNFIDETLTVRTAEIVNDIIGMYRLHIKEVQSYRFFHEDGTIENVTSEIEETGKEVDILFEGLPRLGGDADLVQGFLYHVIVILYLVSFAKNLTVNGQYSVEKVFGSTLVEYIIGKMTYPKLPGYLHFPGPLQEFQFKTIGQMRELDLNYPGKDDPGYIKLKGILQKDDISLLDLSTGAQRALLAFLRIATEQRFDKWSTVSKKSDIYYAADLDIENHGKGRVEFKRSQREQIDAGIDELRRLLIDYVIDESSSNVSSIDAGSISIFRYQQVYVDRGTGKVVHVVERDRDMENLPPNSKLSQIRFMFHPIISANARNFYKQIPANLYRQIEQYMRQQRKRMSKYQPSFIIWLSRQWKTEVRIDRRKLAEHLRLDHYLKRSQYIQLNKILITCFDTAKNLGFLTDYKTGVPDKKTGRLKLDVFFLNPQRFPSLVDLIEQKKKNSDSDLSTSNID